MHKKKVTALVAAMSVCVAAFAGYTVYNVSQSTDRAIKQDIKEYLEEYSHTVNLDNNVLGDAGVHAENGYTLLTKDEVAELSDTVYSAISSNYTEGTPMTEEDITNIKEQVYNAVYNQLCDKTSTEVINNVYDNILAVCLDDLYMYADMKDATLKSALEAQLKVLANNLTDTSKRIDTAEADYNTLSVMLGEYKAETEKDYETMSKYYQALGNSLESVNGTIADNTISIKALEASNKETADKLNNLITSDLATGNDNQAMSAAAGKSLVETMTTYYLNNNKNIDQLSKDVAGNISDIDIELANLNAGINSNKDNVSNLNNRADGIQSDIDNLINELNNTDSSTINNTINNITKELTELLVNQNTDVREVLNYLQNLYSSADEESRKLIQQLIVELSKTQADADVNLVKLLQLLSEAQKAPDADTYNSIVNQMKEIINNIQVSSPEVYNKLEQYLEKLYAGDTSVLNNIIDIISGTLVEHNANLSTYIKNMLSMIENSEFAGDQLFIDIVNKIRELQSFDTTSLQHSIYTSLHNLFLSIGSDTETMYNAINEAMKELGKANQDVFNQLNDAKNELSDDLAYTYYLLSTDLKITNEELTNEIYNNYLNLSTTAENNKEALTQALADTQKTLEESDAANKEELSLALQTAKDYLTSVDEKNAEAFNNALNNAQNALTAADAANKESLEKLVSDTNEALKTADAENKADLENQLKTARAELDAIDARNLQQLTKLSNDNKNELSANLAQAKKELEDSDLANKTELTNALTRAEEALKSDDAKNKQELENALAEAQRLLEEADATNTAALNKALSDAQAKLEQDDADNKEVLTQALADAKRTLEESDAANKAELSQALLQAKNALEAADIANKDALNLALTQAKNALEAADDANKAELESALEQAKKALEDTDTANKNELTKALAQAKNALEAADSSNREELINRLNNSDNLNIAERKALKEALEQADANLAADLSSATDALSKSISDEVAALVQADADNLQLLQNADITINNNINQLMTDNSEKDAAQDVAIQQAKSKADEAFQSASKGKEKLAQALAGEAGVSVANNASYDTIASAITSIGNQAHAEPNQMLQSAYAYVGDKYVQGNIPTQSKDTVNVIHSNGNMVSLTSLNNLVSSDKVVIPSGYYPENISLSVASLYDQTRGTAVSNDILSGKTAYINGQQVTGTMTNNGAVAKSLTAGQSYTIPWGFHNGSGTVSVATLASQTGGTATAGQILSGQTAWVNGSQVTGSMPNKGAWNSNTTGASKVTIPAGYHNGSGYVDGTGAYNAGVTKGHNDVKNSPGSYLTAGKLTLGSTNGANVDITDGYYGTVDTTAVYNQGVTDADARENTSSYNWWRGRNTGYDQGVSDTKKGNAGAGDVLAGKTFTSSSGVEQTGTRKDIQIYPFKQNFSTATGDVRASFSDGSWQAITKSSSDVSVSVDIDVDGLTLDYDQYEYLVCGEIYSTCNTENNGYSIQIYDSRTSSGTKLGTLSFYGRWYKYTGVYGQIGYNERVSAYCQGYMHTNTCYTDCGDCDLWGQRSTNKVYLRITSNTRCEKGGSCTSCKGGTYLRTYGTLENTWIEGTIIAIPK